MLPSDMRDTEPNVLKCTNNVSHAPPSPPPALTWGGGVGGGVPLMFSYLRLNSSLYVKAALKKSTHMYCTRMYDVHCTLYIINYMHTFLHASSAFRRKGATSHIM